MVAAFSCSFASSTLSQMRVIDPENVKALSAPVPSFSAEAKVNSPAIDRWESGKKSQSPAGRKIGR